MATLIIITGPNGAGKSTTSQRLLEPYGIKAFDFDLLFNEKWRAFNYDPQVLDGIRMNIIDEFNRHMHHAYTNGMNVSFETNFHDQTILKHINEARSHGFKTELIFIGLPKISLAIKRVQQREALGGHSVDLETIKFRFKEGLKTLDETFDKFDNVNLFESRFSFKPVLKCIYIENGQFKVFNRPSFIDQLPKLKQYLAQQDQKQ